MTTDLDNIWLTEESLNNTVSQSFKVLETIYHKQSVISHNTDTTSFSHKRHQSLQSSFSLAFPVCHS